MQTSAAAADTMLYFSKRFLINNDHAQEERTKRLQDPALLSSRF